MKRFSSVLFALLAVMGLGVVVSGSAHAALTLTGVTVDTTDYITIATFLVTALVAFWGVKKGIGLLGR